jgi:transposase InsO family protein
MLPGPTFFSASAPPLKTANGGQIKTGAERRISLSFVDSTSSSHSFSWDFLFGSVDNPILGNDFLKANHLVVDPASACVRHLSSNTVYPGEMSFSAGSASAVLPTDLAVLLQRFPSVVSSSGALPPPIHDVLHHLETTGQPVTARFRRLDAEKLAAAKKIFADWESSGIIRRSSSAWSSPLHMVAKKDGSWRPCGDFRRLNLVTSADKYPVPNMGDFSGPVEGCHIFSTLDLKNGYLQVPLHPSAIPKTALITPFGLFEFLRMPFGLKNAGMSFQRLMDRIMAGLPFVFVYIDDILVASPDFSTHLSHLRVVLERLQTAGLVLNVEKCVFAKPEVNFLGHRISAAGSTPLPDRITAISQHPQPGTIKELQQFLGMLNFYRKFLPSAARILCPLTNALKGGLPGSTPLVWSPEMMAAFAAAKQALAAATLLVHPLPAAELSVVCDASASHVGAALQQRRNTAAPWQPLGFFSQKLDSAQLSYSAFDRELFAAYAAIRHFRYQLEGRCFTLWTDHKPLTHSVRRSDEAWTPRQQRQMAYIAEFTADVRHIAGEENVVADALSRPPVALSSPTPTVRREDRSAGARPALPVASALPVVPPFAGDPVDLAVIADSQLLCPDTISLAASSSLSIQRIHTDGKLLLCDFSTGHLRPLLPVAHRISIFNAVHSLGHPGIRATRRLISARWVWKGMSSDIAAWCADCQLCQRSKITRQHTAPLQQFAVPSTKFSHIHVDLVGPLPSSNGFTHLLTIVDRTTRWLEAIPLSSTTATAVADALVAGWVARFGVPADLSSDRGVQFTSEVWAILMSRLKIRHHTTTAYHPQSNGMVERSHRQIKDTLRARLAGNEWVVHLPWVLLSIRAAPKDDSAISAAEMVYGSPILLPGHPLLPPPPPQLSSPGPAPAASRLLPPFLPVRQHTQPSEPPSLPTGLASAEFVYIRRGGASTPLSPSYSGPYRVISRSPKYFTLDLGDRSDVVSVDRLKPHSGASALQPAAAPRRGRPPLSATSTNSSLGAGSCGAHPNKL